MSILRKIITHKKILDMLMCVLLLCNQAFYNHFVFEKMQLLFL